MNTLDIRLSILDVNYWKDLLAGYINSGIWAPHKEVGRSYVTQMASEHKIMVQQKIKPDQTTIEDWRWVIRAAGLPNHYWDCEVYATVAAHMIGADELVPEPEMAARDDPLETEGRGWTSPDSYTRNGSWL